MSAKEQLINLLDVLGENEVKLILLYINETFLLETKTWDDIEEDNPTPDEVSAFMEYRADMC
jgi:hypothetical protein